MIVPALKRLDMLHSGKLSLTVDLNLKITQKMKELKKKIEVSLDSLQNNHFLFNTILQQRQRTKGKESALIEDVEYIINSIPDLHPDKEEEACLYLLAVCCGARASTCAAIQLRDLKFVSKDQDGTYTITVYSDISQNFTKQ